MKGFITIWMFVLMPFCIYAQEPAPSFEEVMKEVEANFPQLQTYAPMIKAAAERAEAARSWMPPTLTVGLDRIPYRVNMIQEEGPMNQAGIMIGVEQMIPSRARLNAASAYAGSLASEQQQALERSKAQFRLQAAQGFLGAVYSAKKQEVLEQTRQVLQLLHRTAMEKVPFGSTRPADLYKLEARIADVENMMEMARAEEKAFKSVINLFMLRDPAAEIKLSESQYQDPMPQLLDSVSVMLRPDIRAMDQRIRSMELGKDLMLAGAKPDFGFQFRHMQMFGMPSMFAVMGMVTVPIAPWSSPMYRSESAAMQYEIEAMEKERQSMALMSLQMIAEKNMMAEGLQNQVSRLDNEIIPALEKALQAEINAYSQNTGDLYSLLDTWEMLLMKRVERLDKEYELRIRRAELAFETYTSP